MNEAPWRVVESQTRPERRDHPCMSLKRQRRSADQSPLLQFVGHTFTRIERLRYLVPREIANATGYRQVQQIRIGRNLAGRYAHDRRVAREINGVGNDCSGGVRFRGGFRESGDRVGDAQREAAAAPTAGRYAPNRHGRGNFEGSEERWAVRTLDHADGIVLAVGQVQRDIATLFTYARSSATAAVIAARTASAT